MNITCDNCAYHTITRTDYCEYFLRFIFTPNIGCIKHIIKTTKQ